MAKIPDGWVAITVYPDRLTIGLETRELVMCKNCKHYEPDMMTEGVGWCNELAIAESNDFWCARGEKKTDDKDLVRG